jgi:hypothetical protein
VESYELRSTYARTSDWPMQHLLRFGHMNVAYLADG